MLAGRWPSPPRAEPVFPQCRSLRPGCRRGLLLTGYRHVAFPGRSRPALRVRDHRCGWRFFLDGHNDGDLDGRSRSRGGRHHRGCRSGVGIRISGGASSSTRRPGCSVGQGERPAAGQAAPDAFEAVLVVIVVNCGPCTIKGVEARFSLEDRSLVPGRGNKPVPDFTALPSGLREQETRPRRARCRGS